MIPAAVIPSSSATSMAAAAWSEFVRAPTSSDVAQPCWPILRLNSTADHRQLSSLIGVPIQKRPPVCEQPSEKAHLRRLEAAARARGHQLSALVIGANRMGNEGNEWFGSFIRKYGWRAGLLEPVPQLFTELRANFRGRADVSVHQLAVHANRSAIRGAGPDGLGQCGFFYTQPKCSSFDVSTFN